VDKHQAAASRRRSRRRAPSRTTGSDNARAYAKDRECDASGLIFSGDNDGNLLALDSRTGALRGGSDGSQPAGTSAITYMVDGRQHVLVPAGTSLTAWALPVERWLDGR
jgi:hypothetical protein